MLRQSKASEPSISAPVVNSRATRANAPAVGVKRLHSNLPGRRASSATLQRASVEVELKLGVTPEHLDILKRHPFFRNQRSRRKDEVVSVYLDTKDRVFHRHGLSYRLRRKGKQLLQTIKGPYRGVLDRSEQETPFSDAANGHPDSADALMRRLDRNVPTALKPIFKTRIERETYQIGGVEVCLDRGKVIAGRRSSRIVEIELELKSGDRRELFGLARQISAIVPAEVSVKSKSDRGYDLVEGIKDRAIIAQDPVLPPFPTVAEAFQIICGECLHQLISNRPGVRAHMAEALHQARVALRRLDAAVKLFRTIQSEKATKVAGELKWIGDELADARELDVFVAEFLGPLRSRRPTGLGLAKVYRASVQLREEAYERANAALSSQRFRLFLIDVVEWIETGGGDRKASSLLKGEPSAKDIVSRTLSKISRKTKAFGRVEELDLRSLHKLRLRAKRMRYTIEFTRSLYEANPERVEEMIKQLGKLQSAIGNLTDRASAKTLLSRIATEAKADPKSVKLAITTGSRIMTGDKKRQKSKQLKKAAKAYEKLGSLKPFWI
jgi:triphosphatase